MTDLIENYYICEIDLSVISLFIEGTPVESGKAGVNIFSHELPMHKRAVIIINKKFFIICFKKCKY